MFFKRKPRNRRLGREYVLDVKLRSSQVRAARVRMAALALGVVFCIVIGLFAVWRAGQWALNELVYENKAFAIEEIAVQTDGVISVDQLLRWTAAKKGDNLLALDLARVKRDLELVSQIQSASVERVLPHTLRVRVVEREPLVQINAPRPKAGGGMELATVYLDPEGYVFLPLDWRQRVVPASQAADQFPVISGFNANLAQAGRRIDSPQVQGALRLITAFDHSPMAGLVDLNRIDVSATGVLVATTGQGSEVTFSLASPDQQLRRWREIFDMAQKTSRVIATLDLAVSNNIPARWLEASAVPVTVPKPPKTPRKKHV